MSARIATRSASDDQEIDLVAQDRFSRDLGGARHRRLAVLANDLGLAGLAAVLETGRQELLHLVEDERVGLAEGGERPGTRADMAYSDHPRLGMDGNDPQHRRHGSSSAG